MSIKREVFGEHSGKEVYLYTLNNENGLTAQITNYGGILKSLIFDGVDVVLGQDTLEAYLDNDWYFGALVGRNSNRIAKSEFTLNGKKYNLCQNDGKNNLHGGNVNFSRRVWDANETDEKEPSLELSLTSPDGEEGFPGKVEVKVTYTLTGDNSLRIHYEGVSDKDTILNMTNHAYFNLNGHESGAVDGHTLWLESSFYTPSFDESMPTGEILSVDGTPFDFRTDATLGERFLSGHEQIKLFGGFDHNFPLEGFGYRYSGKVVGDKSGICMELYTDRPAVQVFTANGIDGKRACKGGVKYASHGGLCLETQCYPRFTDFSHFQGGFLKKGEKYDTVTAYKFSK